MKRFILSVTVATAAMAAAMESHAQTLLYSYPGAPHEVADAKPLGAFIAARITHADASAFKQWMANSTIQKPLDVTKGYTAFAVVNDAFNASAPAHTAEHYIVEGRMGLSTMHGNADEITAINGDTLILSRTGNSYYVDGMRVNDVIKNPEGTIYIVGGMRSAQNI